MSSWTRLQRTVAPSDRPVTLDEAKSHLRVDIAADDTLITRLIDAVTDYIEGPNGLGIALISQEWKVAFDFFPRVIEIPLWPVISIDQISYVDPDGTSQTVDSFQSDVISSPARALPDYNTSWPQTRNVLNAVEVTFTAGFGTDSPPESNVPDDIRAAILLILGHWYENREASIVGTAAVELPMGAESILNRYRIGRVGG